jgi:glycosyltransferase involved in cell wall biosynthesis
LRKRILFISHTSNLTGAEKCLYALLEGLNRDEFIPLVLFPGDGPLAGKVRGLGQEILIYKIPWWIAYGKRTWRHFREVFFKLPERVGFLRKTIRDRKIDLVYTNTITCIDGAIAAKSEGVPHVWHIHEHITGHPDLKPYVPKLVVNRMVLALSDRIIVPSNNLRMEYGQRNAFNSVEVVYNGVDVDEFAMPKASSDEPDFRESLGIDRSKKVIALVGYFHEIKGQMDFVEAAGKFSGETDNLVFLLVGEGVGNLEYTDAVKRRVKDLGLVKQVLFVPFQDNIHAVYRAIDICVSASRLESFSNVLVEAMAAAKPVIATCSGGPEEIVVDGETGYLVPVKHPALLAHAIGRLLSNEQEAAEMGRKGLERVQKLFQKKQYVNNIQRVIRELCG